MACIFTVGEKFESVASLSEKIKQFELENYVQLWKRYARKIIAAKTITKSINEDLVHCSIKYCCSQGGRKFSSRSTGERNAATLKTGCSFTLSLRADTDGKYLEVKKLSDQHNHIVEKKLFQHLARQRKLSDVERTEVEKLLQIDCNKNVSQQKVMSETNRIVTLKDIHNIASKAKKRKNSQ